MFGFAGFIRHPPHLPAAGVSCALSGHLFLGVEKCNLSRWAKTGLLLPILWTLAEFARERFLTGFGWGAIGYSQIIKDSPLAGFAPLGGIHMVTLATAFLSAWLVLLIDNHGRLKHRLLPLFLIVALCSVGYISQQPNTPAPTAAPVRSP